MRRVVKPARESSSVRGGCCSSLITRHSSLASSRFVPIRQLQILEQALAVEGGEKLAAVLGKLRDASKAQEMKAEELHTRTTRSAEAASVVLANAETRYGGIYQAVVESPETAPAELAFYKG